MFRLVEPAAGRINIDKTQTEKLGLHDLRGNLTIIPQEPVLFRFILFINKFVLLSKIFSGTLRENLDPFDEYKDSNLWRALENSHLKTAVTGFEKQLDHEINENGSNLR